MDRLAALREAGVSIWLDTLSRELLETGDFSELVANRHVTGATSNPTIFAKAITGSDRYQTQLTRLLDGGHRDPRLLFLALALEDVRQAADIRPLWASTGTKNPAYSDVLYVESLVADGVVNTMPRDTLDAFADHGNVDTSLTTAAGAATILIDELHGAGVDLARITDALEREGVQSFCDAYAQLLACIQERAAASVPRTTRRVGVGGCG